MRKPGGFRRCRVILADHPELYPLSNICAWLHHETTGLWPNEGCHHPGMKNCKGKLKKRGFTNAQFNQRLTRAINAPGKMSRSMGTSRALGKGDSQYEVKEDFFSDASWRSKSEDINMVTNEDFKHASFVLMDFVALESEFVKYIRDDENWELEGEDMLGLPMTAPYTEEKCCG